MALNMTQDEISLKDLTVGDPLDLSRPQVSEVSANLVRKSRALWGSLFRINSGSHCPCQFRAADSEIPISLQASSTAVQ